jgi:hypothetical protein
LFEQETEEVVADVVLFELMKEAAERGEVAVV